MSPFNSPNPSSSSLASVGPYSSQPDAERAREQHGRVVEALEGCYPEVAEMVEEAREEILAFAVFPLKL